MSRILFENFEVSESNIILSATETTDISTTNFSNIIQSSFDILESIDTGEFDIANIVSTSFIKTENIDTAVIDSDTDITSELDATESQDKAVIKVRGRIVLKRVSHSSQNLIPLILKLKKANAILKATEQQDGISVYAIKEVSTRARASESGDGIKCFIDVSQLSQMATSEPTDKSIVDEERMKEFKNHVEKVYNEYEMHQIRMFLIAA